MAVSFIHTADWQIGKPFGGVADDAAALLRDQRLKTVEAIARLATSRGVDAILVAGDVFDSNAVSDQTIRRLLNALSGFAGPWVLLPGNHDPALVESAWARLLRFGPPANIHVAAGHAPLLLADGRLAVLPAPLERRQDTRDLTEYFDRTETPADAVRVGLAHGCVANRLPDRGEAINPIAEDRAERARLSHLALGDWHGTLNVAPRTWYSGTPEPDRFKTNDAGNVLHVTVSAPGEPANVERIPVGHYRWHIRQATVHGVDDLAALDAEFAALDAPYDRHLVSLTLSGAVGLDLRARIGVFAETWAARLRHLDIDLDALVTEPTDDDLDLIDKGGFVRVAVDRLRAIARDPVHPDRAVAALALQRLYVEHRRLGG